MRWKIIWGLLALSLLVTALGGSWFMPDLWPEKAATVSYAWNPAQDPVETANVHREERVTSGSDPAVLYRVGAKIEYHLDDFTAEFALPTIVVRQGQATRVSCRESAAPAVTNYAVVIVPDATGDTDSVHLDFQLSVPEPRHESDFQICNGCWQQAQIQSSLELNTLTSIETSGGAILTVTVLPAQPGDQLPPLGSSADTSADDADAHDPLMQ